MPALLFGATFARVCVLPHICHALSFAGLWQQPCRYADNPTTALACDMMHSLMCTNKEQRQGNR